MKILKVISSLFPMGGAETFATNFCIEISKIAELKVVILYKKNRDFFISKLKQNNIDFVILDRKGQIDFKNAKQLREIILNFKPDVIHTENNALIQTFLALRKTNYKKSIKVFHTMHLIPEQECSHPLVRLMYKRIFKKQNYIPVAITKQLAEVSARFYKKDNVPVVYNGTDLTNNKNNIPVHKRKYDVVVVGRFSPEKNHKFLIDSFIKLKDKVPSLKVALVGGGPLLQEMTQYCNKLNANDFIEFTGILYKPYEVVNDSKIIALGSLFEANPLSLIEGMASGCIVVASNTGGIPDVIHEPKNGFLFNINDNEKFVEIVSKILKNIDRYKTISEFNTNYAKQFSMESCAKEYYELFADFKGERNE